MRAIGVSLCCHESLGSVCVDMRVIGVNLCCHESHWGQFVLS